MRIYPALLSVALLAALPALAQTQAPDDQAQAAPGHAATKMDTYHARLNQRISSMRQRLAITPAEQAAWNEFADTMRQNANDIEQAFQKRAAAFKTMTAPENMQNYAEIEQERAQDLQKLAAAFSTLYNQLSEQQKHTADAMFRQYELQQREAHQGAAPNKQQ